MGTLKNCLKRIGLEAHEQAIINGAVQDNLADGYTANEAATAAVKDYIGQLQDERKDIDRQIKEKAPAAAEPAELKTVKDVVDKWKAQGVDLALYESKQLPGTPSISLQHLSVPKEMRKQGIGSKVMRDITELADKTGRRVMLTPATKDDNFGTTSRARLVKFYKHFGFVQNKGRHKDFRINESMYREPKQKNILASVKRPYANISNEQLGIGAGRKNKYQSEIQVTIKYKGQDPWQALIGGYNLEHALERARRNWPGAEITPGELARPGEIIASPKYARVTSTDSASGKTSTIFLKDIVEGPTFIKGIEVDKEGEEVTRRGVDERIHLIDRSAIKKIEPYQMNLKYGELEKAPVSGITASLKMNPDSNLGIPEFIGTNDAIVFGRTATIEQISEMRKLAISIRADAAKLLSEGRAANDMEKFEASLNQGYRAQFLDEAVQAAEGDADRMISMATFGRTELVDEADTKLEDPKFSVKKTKFVEAPKVQFSTNQKIKMRTTGSIAAAGNVILSVDDAASLIAGIRKAAQENAYSIVTGEDGTVLEIHRYGKGTSSSAYVNANEIMGRAFNVPGAKDVYFVHNHPSGGNIASPQDVRLTERLEGIAKAAGLRVHSFVIGGTRYIDIGSSSSNPGAVHPIRPTVRKVTIPVKERYLIKTGEGIRTAVYNPADMKAWIDKWHPNDAGIAFLDLQNTIVGWMNSISHLTPIQAFTEIYKGAESTGSAAIMFITPTKMSTELKRVISQISIGMGEVNVLDIVEGGQSLAEAGVLKSIVEAHTEDARAIWQLRQAQKTLNDMQATFSLKRTDINRAIERGSFSEEDIRIAGDLESLTAIDESMNLGGGGNPQVHAQNVNKWLDKNGYAVWRLRQIEDFSRVKLLDSSGHMIMDSMESKTKVKPYGIQVPPEKPRKERGPADIGFPQQGDVVPLYPGLARSWVQTYFDALDPIRRESFRSAVSNSIEAAYRGVEKVSVGELGVTFENLGAKKDYAIPRPVRIAHKTMATLNLNQQCPMMAIGSHGCYLDGCYVVGQAIGGQVVNYYRSAMYTGELLQLAAAEIKRINAAGGLRINGNGDTSIADLPQWRDVFKHAEMRGLKLKIITKADDTMAVIDQLRKEGSKTAAETVIQTSMDPYWIEVKTYDDIPGSGVRREGVIDLINSGDLEGAAKLFQEKFKHDAKVVNGKLFRKYGYSWEQINKLGKQYPELRFLPRVVVSTPKEIAEYALRLPEVLQTWMHAKLRPGMWSDIMGAPVDAEHGALNFGDQIAIKQIDGEWRILRQQTPGSLAVTEGPQYTAVEEYIKTNYNKKDQDKIFNTLSGHLRRDPSALCCQISASKDACAACQSSCAMGSFHTGTEMVEMSQRGMDGLAAGVNAIGRENAILASLKGPAPAPGPVWYSRMEQHLGAKLPNRIDTESLWPLLKSFVDGGKISGEELEWSGIEDWIEDQSGKVTKRQITDYLAENNIRVKEVLRTDNISSFTERRIAAWDRLVNMEPGDTGYELAKAEHKAAEAAENAAEKLQPRHGRGNLVLPGGKNYRELVITLAAPAKRKKSKRHIELQEKIDSGNFVDSDLVELDALRDKEGSIDDRKAFTAAHYPEKDILVHIRFNERTDKEGKRVLFIEEVQSDWHQKGRQPVEEGGGYQTLHPEKMKKLREEVAEARAALAAIDEKVAAEWKRRVEAVEGGGGLLEAGIPIHLQASAVNMGSERLRALTYLHNVQYDLDYPIVVGVPDAPFKTSWQMLAMKRMVRWAAEENFDRISWTTGSQQISRYEDELRRNVDRIEWKSNKPALKPTRALLGDEKPGRQYFLWDGMEKISGPFATKKEAEKKNSEIYDYEFIVAPEDTPSEYKEVTAHKGGRVVFSGVVEGEKFTDGAAGGKTVAEVLGKGMAKQVTEQDSGSIEGKDLSVGGQLHKFVYDVNIPQEMNKFFGKEAWGKARVGTTEINTDKLYAKSGIEIEGVTTARRTEYTRSELGRIADAIRYDISDRDDLERSQWRQGIDTANAIERGEYNLDAILHRSLIESNYPSAVRLLKPALRVDKVETVHSMDITPEMREKSVKFGMPLFSLKSKSASPFYSQLEDVIRNRKLSGPPAEVAKSIKAWARKGDVKDEEVQWSGILRFLAGKTAPNKITTKLLLNYLEDNNVQVHDIWKLYYPTEDLNEYDINTEEEGVVYVDWQRKNRLEGVADYDPDSLQQDFPGEFEDEDIEMLKDLQETAEELTSPGDDEFKPGHWFSHYTLQEAQNKLVMERATRFTANLPGGFYSVTPAPGGYEVKVKTPDGIESLVGQFDKLQDALDEVEEEEVRKAQDILDAGTAKYARYAKGSNSADDTTDTYKELLLTIPITNQKEIVPPGYLIHADGNMLHRVPTEQEAIDAFELLKTYYPNSNLTYRYDEGGVRPVKGKTVFKGGHWDEKNVVVHVRMTERRAEGGGTELYIEEIQSDWHQKARKAMYIDPALDQQNFASWLFKRKIPWSVEIQKAWDDRGRLPENVNDPWPERGPLVKEYFEEQKMAAEQNQKGVPDAPFKRTWAMLAVKRMVRYAAENGYTGISWSTGEQQHNQWGSERFDWERVDEPEGGEALNTEEAEYEYRRGALIAFRDTSSGELVQIESKSAFYQGSNYWNEVLAGRGQWLKGFVSQINGMIPGRNGWVVNCDEQFSGDVFANLNLDREASRETIFIPDEWEEKGKLKLRSAVEKTIDREKREYSDEKWAKRVDSVTDKVWAGMHATETGRYLPRYEGFKGFYDDILIKDINKFFDRPEWGNARVTTKKLFLGDKYHERDIVNIDELDVVFNVTHYLPITDEMYGKVLDQGMPLFSLKKIQPPGDSYLDAVNSVLGTAVVTTTKDTDVDPYGGLDQDIKDSMEASKGVKAATRWQKLKQEGKDIWYSSTRHRPYLDPEDNGQITDILRTHQETGENAVRRAMQILEHIIAGLKPKQYEIFSLSLIMDDMVKDVQSGLLEDKQNLPFGFNEQKMLDYQAYLHSAISADPAIASALRRRQAFQAKLRKALVDADLLHKDVLNDDRYFHHQVLQYRSYQEDKVTYQGIGVQAKDVRMQRKGWQKGRIGSVAEYNTSYAESEFEVISQGLAQLETMHTMNQLKKLADILPEMTAQAKHQNYVAVVGGQDNYDRLVELRGQKAAIQQNEPLDSDDRKMIKQINDEIRALDPTMPFRSKIAMGYARLTKALGLDIDPDMDLEEGDLGMKTIAMYAGVKDDEISVSARTILAAIAGRAKFIKETLGRDFKTAKSLMPAGYTMWLPSKGQSWYKAFSITDRLVAAINEGEETLGQENAGKIKTVLAKAKNPEWMIPEGLAKTLDGYDQQYENHWMSKRSRQLMSGWKSWTLLSPPRVLKYNLNNMSGDLDIVLAYRPEIFYKYFWKAWGDLSKEMKDKDVSAGLKAELDKAYALSVLGSGWSVQEVSDVAGQLAMKQRLDAMTGNNPSLIERYWENTKKYTQFRENLLRLAAFRYFKDQIAQGKNVYGASNMAEVDGITDPDRKAAKLARELLGDYGNITHAGLWMRAHAMPFYSWMEVNAPRYVRLMRNLPHEEGAGLMGAPRIVAAAGAKVAGAVAMKSLPLMMKMAGFFVLASLWNRLRFPDEEDELGESQRAQMHLILGRRADGSIITMRLQGAFSDAISWFGAESAIADVTKMIKGKKSISDQAKSMLLATPKKLIGAVRPDVKGFSELLTAKSLYPDPFNPGTIRDRAEYLARSFSLDSAYRWAIGRPQRGDTLGRQMFNSLTNLLAYTSDPGEMAYYDITRLGHDWKNDNKPDAKDKADALYYWKQSMKFGDLKAGEKYMRQYYDYGGTDQGLKQSIKMAHPLGMLSKKDQKSFKETLSPAELQRLELAEEWYNRTYKGEAAEASRAHARGEIVDEDFLQEDTGGGMTLRDALKLK